MRRTVRRPRSFSDAMLLALTIMAVADVRTVTNGLTRTVTLNNGLAMPTLAFAANVWDADTCKTATLAALDNGFRFVWSSALIGSPCQSAQAEALAATNVSRSEIFVSGTVDTASCSGHDDCYQQTKAGAESQFGILGSNLDMLMLDYPSSSGCDGILGQWQAFSELYTAKKVKSIGVSNFGAAQLECVKSAAVVPAANQMPVCVSCGDPVPVVAANAAAGGIVVQAYSPLGSGTLLHDPLLKTIGSAHAKSPAQVALRWLLQHNVTIATQSTNPAHLASDADIYDFALTAGEMAQLDADHGRR